MNETTDTSASSSIVLESLQLILSLFYHILHGIYRIIIPANELDVSNEIVLVTGSGHGIGREICRKYCELGATVIGIDINEENNMKTMDEMKAIGGKYFSFRCNVTDRKAVFDIAERIKNEIGPVSILINNAGIIFAHRILEQTENEIRNIFNVNILSHYWTLQAFLPIMLENNHGHIVAICSISGLFGVKNIIPYSATKFAIRGTMDALSDELNSNNKNNQIKLTTIYPYLVDTGLVRPLVRFKTLMNVLRPQDVASAVVSAQRRHIEHISIPSYWLYAEALSRLLPGKWVKLFNQHCGIGIGSDKKNL